MLAERGISVNRSTIYRWFIEYSPKLRKKLRRNYQFIQTDSFGQLDETYVKVKGTTCIEPSINKGKPWIFISLTREIKKPPINSLDLLTMLRPRAAA